MAGDSSLKLQVVFAALDKLSAPIERMRRGSRGLAADMAKTRSAIKALGDAQRLVGTFKVKEAGYAKQTAQLEQARAATAKFRAELAATDQPTIKMAKNLERAEKYERVLTEQHEKQGRALDELRSKLDAAGVDVAQLGTHEERLARQLGEANTALEQQQARAARLGENRARGERLQEAGGRIAGAGAAVSVGVGAPAAMLLRESYQAAIESRDALGQVAASMANMGGAAGRTLPQLEAQAKRLQHISTFDDDDILRNVTTAMTTFDRISGPMFDRAQTAAVNLSEKFGKDLSSSAIMVGKALQDPIKGLSALSRIGVSFGPAQKQQIKAMVEAGNVAGAQAIIMAELERQTRGAGMAARAAKPGSDTLDQWRDFTETIGASLIALLPPLTAALAGLLGAFNALSPEAQTFFVGLLMAAVALGPLLGLVGGLISIIGTVMAAFSVAALPAIGIILAIVAVAGLLGYAAYKVYQNWGAVSGFFSRIWNAVAGIFVGAWNRISNIVTTNWTTIRNVFLGALVIFFPLIAAVIYVASLVYRNWDKIKAATMRLAGVFGAIVGYVMRPFTAIFQFLGGIVGKFFSFGVNIVSGLIKGIVSMAGSVLKAIWDLAAKVGGAFAKALGINSPSRVFMAMGGHITDGLALGLDRGGKNPLRSMARLAAGVSATAALGVASPSLANAGPGSVTAAQASTARSVTFNVTIQLTGSGDPRQDAAEIKRVLVRLLAIEARGSYEDE